MIRCSPHPPAAAATRQQPPTQSDLTLLLRRASVLRRPLQVNIILVTKDGSRWPNARGERVCDFPPYELIGSLPEAVRPAFTKKAIAHSDECAAVAALLCHRLLS